MPGIQKAHPSNGCAFIACAAFSFVLLANLPPRSRIVAGIKRMHFILYDNRKDFSYC